MNQTPGAVPLLEMRRAPELWSEKLNEIVKAQPSVHSFEAKEATK